VFANKSVGQIADHVDDVISALHTRPAVVGHSFGGLLTQIVAGRGIAAASVPIDPAPGRGILPLPFSALKVASVALKNPANRGKGVGLTFEQFVYGFGNAIPEDEARRLYDAYSVPGPAKVLFQAAAANMNPASETKTDTKNPERGAMLVISGGKDHTVPPSVAKAAYKRQRKNPGVTEFHQFDDRGHSLAMDHGWQEVADTALAFVTEHAPPT
jgi:pimeloyl-ACP methyl ester carboxylesterase